MAGAELLKRIVTTCGECLIRWHPDASNKSPKTAHRIVDTYKDEELGCRVQVIECTRCHTRTEWVPRHHVPKAEAERLKLKWELDGYEKRQLAKLAKRRRLLKETEERQKKRKKKAQPKRRTRKG